MADKTNPNTPPSSQKSGKDKPKPAPEHKDTLRKVVETVVFVVVLVIMMQSFVAEAFVIPTGSMAVTLLGDHKWVKCEKCGHEFTVNSHSEVEPGTESPEDAHVIGCTCPNCLFNQNIGTIGTDTGDRLLVEKSPYSLYPGHPSRFDVVVFKYPREPVQNAARINYIKRLVGQPGETIAIYKGDLYVSILDSHPSGPDNLFDDWRFPHTKEIDRKELQNFEIVRKPPEQILAMRRIVNDNDAQDPDQSLPRRWQPENGWKAMDNPLLPKTFERMDDGMPADNQKIQWLRYRHILRGSPKRQLITDFIGYNTAATNRGSSKAARHWVGDLILECDLTVSTNKGCFAMELSRGVDRFLARWDLAAGTCTLLQFTDGKETPLTDPVASLLKPGSTYHLRFANVDQRLTVWVDRQWLFGEGVCHNRDVDGPTENDLQPASIGTSGASVRISKLKLFRDTYYTLLPGDGDSALWDEVRPRTRRVDELKEYLRSLRSDAGASKPRYNDRQRETLLQDAEKDAGFTISHRNWQTSFDKALPESTSSRLGDLVSKNMQTLAQFTDALAKTLTKEEMDRFEETLLFYAAKDALEDKNLGLFSKALAEERDKFADFSRDETTEDLKKPWKPFPDMRCATIYVQPPMYLCLGDNSPGSSDGRVWGLVPDRLLLGRAVVVYWPLSRFGRIK